ncbi:MAG TPA: SEC-C metal-binding domain-containing protein [Terracidiphilus sp.]|nr:SEC-C metal-binding domain-containing protein [Terracidiphilus sp.]
MRDNAAMELLVQPAKAGRNDPCPCGSGKKYKRCCLSNQLVVEDSPWQKQRIASDSLTDEMLKFARRRFDDCLDEAWMDFNQWPFPDPLEKDVDESQIFFPYLLFDWHPDPPTPRRGNRPKPGIVAQEYVLERGHRLSDLERLILELSIVQPVSFYEVLRCDPGHGMLLRDVLIGGEAEVEEHKGSQRVRIGNILYGQLCPLPGVIALSRMAPLAIPPGRKAEIVALRAQLRRKIAKQNRALAAEDLIRHRETIRTVYLEIRDGLRAPVKLQNTDGDPILFHALTFKIGSAQVAFDALASLAWGESKEELSDDADLAADGTLLSVNFDWRKKGNAMHKTWDNTILGNLKIADRTLTVEVNSANRAKKIREEIERRLGILAKHQSTKTKTPDQLMGEKKRTPKALPTPGETEASEPPIDPEVLDQLRAQMREEMEGWVHRKLPALGGRTPKEAVKDPDGREVVESILLEWEHSAQKPEIAKFLSPDVGAIRNLLHL